MNTVDNWIDSFIGGCSVVFSLFLLMWAISGLNIVKSTPDGRYFIHTHTLTYELKSNKKVIMGRCIVDEPKKPNK